MAIIGYPQGGVGPAEKYYKTSRFKIGFPAWKVFMYNYFPDSYESIVGDAWNMVTEFGYSDRPRSEHLSSISLVSLQKLLTLYQISPSYRKSAPGWYPRALSLTHHSYAIDMPSTPPFIPFSERPHQIYILAKYLRYFYAPSNPAWQDVTFFSRAAKELSIEFPGFEFVIGATEDRGPEDQARVPAPQPEGIRNLGKMDKATFEMNLASSRGMLGIGWPTSSPSPHVGLSYGIPFINPYSLWGWSSFEDKMSWAQSQQPTLKALEAPYVYHVQRDNYTEFVRAIRAALTTETPQFRFPFLQPSYVEDSINQWLNTDWEAEALVVLKDRKNGIEHQTGDKVRVFEM
ncbi:hypothetical protein P7C73_g2210, partial [Tremellales sp. Uapishka_1]